MEVKERSVCSGVVQVARTLCHTQRCMLVTENSVLAIPELSPGQRFFTVLCSIYKDGALSLCGICEFGPIKEGLWLCNRTVFHPFRKRACAKRMSERYWSTTRQLGQF